MEERMEIRETNTADSKKKMWEFTDAMGGWGQSEERGARVCMCVYV